MPFWTKKTPEMTCDPENLEIATFAAGCFWSIELHFQRVAGVLSTKVGYTNGKTLNPTYKDVCGGQTGHAEAVEVQFDKSQVSFLTLVEKFWSIHDPTTLNRQKNDVGTQYRSGIYYHSEEQKEQILESKGKEGHKYARAIQTEIAPAETFYAAEEYHQQYLQKGGQCAAIGSKASIRCYG